MAYVGGVRVEFDTAFVETLATVLELGHPVEIGESLSLAAGRRTIEVLNHSFDLGEPRARLLFNPIRRWNPFRGVGRLVWMLSGSDRVSDIEFYDARATAFSDDGLTVPGSSDGARLFHARPGLDQIASVIELLRRERNTRRAAATIYFPEDAGRVSRDLPCALTLVYNVRNGELHATTVMRANDALGVLPYDVFQFSMLAELVAASVGADFGRYHHFAVSMHIYEENRERAAEIVRSGPPQDRAPRTMEPMPRGNPLEAARRLVRFELEVRRMHAKMTPDAVRGLVQRATSELDPYWADFALTVTAWAAGLSPMHPDERARAFAEVVAAVRPPLRSLLERFPEVADGRG